MYMNICEHVTCVLRAIYIHYSDDTLSTFKVAKMSIRTKCLLFSCVLLNPPPSPVSPLFDSSSDAASTNKIFCRASSGQRPRDPGTKRTFSLGPFRSNVSFGKSFSWQDLVGVAHLTRGGRFCSWALYLSSLYFCVSPFALSPQFLSRSLSWQESLSLGKRASLLSPPSQESVERECLSHSDTGCLTLRAYRESLSQRVFHKDSRSTSWQPLKYTSESHQIHQRVMWWALSTRAAQVSGVMWLVDVCVRWLAYVFDVTSWLHPSMPSSMRRCLFDKYMRHERERSREKKRERKREKKRERGSKTWICNMRCVSYIHEQWLERERETHIEREREREREREG